MKKIKITKTADSRLQEAFARGLNDPQRTAATAPDGFNLILAGPGSGKTRVITYRVAYLIAKGVPADAILLVTFTRRAAREMIGRLETLVGPKASRVWAGTFHHIGNRILRRAAEPLGFSPNFTILDGEDQVDLIRLALDDAGMLGKGEMTPKPATIGHLISYAFNVRRSLADVIADRSPNFADWTPQIEQAASHYIRRKLAANCMDYDDLLSQWSRLLTEFPEQLAVQGRQFAHVLVDEMQDTNIVQLEIVEAIARAGSGNLTAVGDDAQSIYRFRGANYDNILQFPDRNPGARIFRLEINYRSTPQIVAFTNASIANNKSGFPKTLASARPSGVLPVRLGVSDAYEEAQVVCQMILDAHEEGIGLRKMAVLYRNHHDSILLQAELVSRGIPYSVRSGVRFFEQAHIKDVLSYLRVIVNPRDESAWRRLLLLLPGIGPAKSTAVYEAISASSDPLMAIASESVMKIVPIKGKGFFAAFVADLRKIQAAKPETHPADAIAAILSGGYPATVRSRYERPDNRISDIEQLAVLAARYDSLERLVSDLLLAGDVYGVDTFGSEEADEGVLVLSTIHQAKGLEWSRVFVLRLIEDGFPSVRALAEPGGEDEERRIFYVAITRAMDELTLIYPLIISRGSWASSQVTKPSRFLTELDSSLYETASVEIDSGFAWSSQTTETP